MNMKSGMKRLDLRMAPWILLIAVLAFCHLLSFMGLDRDLVSVYDEGFFFLINKPNELFTVQTRPLSLANELQQGLFPNIGEWDVLTLRRVACAMKLLGVVMLVFSALAFFRKAVQNENKAVFSLEMVGCILLVGLKTMFTVVLSGNTFVFFCEMVVLSLSLLAVSVQKKWMKNLIVGIAGFFIFVSMLCNAPAGGMLLILVFLFLVFYDGSSRKKTWSLIAMLSIGIMSALLVTHFAIISFSDITQFIQMALNQTTSGGDASHHSLLKVFVTVLLGVRDIIITTLPLLGIALLLSWAGEKGRKKWLLFLCALVLFYIVQKWQVKPKIYFCSVMTCGMMLYLLKQFEKGENLLKNNIFILCAYLYLMPLFLSFGTNTTIMDRTMHFCAPWGLLIFLLGKDYEDRIVIKNKNGDWLYVFFVVFLLFPALKGMVHSWSYESYVFDKEKPIARMKLTSDQYNYYNEVWDYLKGYGYSSQRDTLLGFCNNEMTVVAMDAIPYTNDQQPTEFKLHDPQNITMPSFMILSEWDAEYLEPYFDSLWPNYRETYDVFEMKHNADPGGALQSTIYLRKNRRLAEPNTVY